eukprot:83487_1
MSTMNILTLLVLFLFDEVEQATTQSIARFASYSAAPLYSAQRLIQLPGTFRNILKIDAVVFLTHIAEPLFDSITLPRNYLLRDDYGVSQCVSKMRSCQVGCLDRLIRVILRLRNVPWEFIAHYYDQHRTTVVKDFHHICLLIVESFIG